MQHSTSRRAFLRALGVSPVLLAGSAPRYDLVVQGGRVIDPSRSVSERLDIGIAGGVITRLASDIPESDARQILDAREKIVTPGLIDVHVHVYDGVAGVGIWPDKACLARGSTTVLDAGSAGATTLAGFRSYVVERAETRVGVLLNLSTLGLTSMRELSSLAYADVDRAARAIEENRDIVFGIKVRMTRDIEGGKDLEALRLARQLAENASVPLMVHIGVASSPVGRFLDELRSGDVVTHSFRARGSILDASGLVLPEALEARQRGVHFDIGHGAGNFSFDTAERALEQDFLPDTISSDIHSGNFDGPVFDLATTLSKFLHLGMSLEQTIACATSTPAEIFSFPEPLGTLREGAAADVAIFELAEGHFELTDSGGATRSAARKLVPVTTVKGGVVYPR